MAEPDPKKIVVLALKAGQLRLHLQHGPRRYVAEDGSLTPWSSSAKIFQSEKGNLKSRTQLYEEGKAFAIKHGYIPIYGGNVRKKK